MKEGRVGVLSSKLSSTNNICFSKHVILQISIPVGVKSSKLFLFLLVKDVKIECYQIAFDIYVFNYYDINEYNIKDELILLKPPCPQICID